MWNEPSTLIMRNLQSSPLPTFRSQCLLPRHHALLSDIYRQALPHRPAKARSPPANSSVAPTPPAAPAENAMPPPATSPANQQPESAPLRRRSPRLNPVQGHAHTIKGPPVTPPHHSSKNSKMARTFPLTVTFNECLGSKGNPLSFASLKIVDLSKRPWPIPEHY